MRRDVDDYDLVEALRLDGGAGPAVPINDAAAAAIIGGAIDRAFGAPGGGGGGGAGGGAGGFGAKLAGGVLAAAAVAGLVWWIVKPDERLQRAASVPMPAAPVAYVEPLPPEKAPIPEVEVVIPVPAPEPEPEREKTPPPRKEPQEAPKSVEDLMAEANAARKAKQWKKADELYLEVVRDHAKSASAQVALVASATLHLEHLGDPKGAQQRFRAAIGRVSGPLAEEARYGLAEAYRALGDAAAEANALDDFLRHHAGSPLADRARSRRGEL